MPLLRLIADLLLEVEDEEGDTEDARNVDESDDAKAESWEDKESTERECIANEAAGDEKADEVVEEEEAQEKIEEAQQHEEAKNEEEEVQSEEVLQNNEMQIEKIQNEEAKSEKNEVEDETSERTGEGGEGGVVSKAKPEKSNDGNNDDGDSDDNDNSSASDNDNDNNNKNNADDDDDSSEKATSRQPKLASSIVKKIRKWAKSVTESNLSHGKKEDVFRKAAMMKHKEHKESLLEASKNPRLFSLASLPKKRDVVKKQTLVYDLEKKLDLYIGDTNKRLERLESFFAGASDAREVAEKISQRESKEGEEVSVMNCIAERINSLEAACREDQERRIKPVEESVGKMKKAFIDTSKAVARLADMEGKEDTSSKEDLARVEMEMKETLRDLKEDMVDLVTVEVEKVEIDLQNAVAEFHSEQEHIHSMVGKMNQSAKPTNTLSSVLGMVTTAFKGMGESLKVVEKKQVILLSERRRSEATTSATGELGLILVIVCSLLRFLLTRRLYFTLAGWH